MVLTRLGSQTCPDEDGSSSSTLMARQQRKISGSAGGGEGKYYHEKQNSSFLRRATSKAMEKSLDLTRHYFVLWVCLIVAVLVVRQFFSDGGFSSSLTLSAALQCFAYILLSVKVVFQWNVDGLSAGSLVLSGVALLARLYPNLIFYGYLPVDKSGDWLYQGVDVCSLLLVIVLLSTIYSISHAKSASGERAAGGRGGGARGNTRGESGGVDGVIGWLQRYWLDVLIFILSFSLGVLLHPNRNRNLPSDISWAFSLYLDSFSMIPQLFLMTQQAASGSRGEEVEKWTAHYLASMAASNLASLVFWWKTSRHLIPRSPGSTVGWAVIGAVVFRNLVMVDYVYHYVKAMVSGEKITLRRWSSCKV